MNSNSQIKKIVVTGYPYAYPYYFKVFEHLKDKENFVFILPKHWEAKKGKVKIDTLEKSGFTIIRPVAISYGGRGLLEGLFKGWTPGIAPILPYLRLKWGSRVLYSCLEPNLLSTLYNGFFAKLFGFKHVLFTWQNVAPEARMSGPKLKLSNALVRLNLALSDGVICGNQKAAEIIKTYNLRPTTYKILICPLSGVDTDKFKPSGEAKEKIILFYGALEKRKGVDVLVEAFNNLQLATNDPQLKLVIIGTGPEQENLRLQVTNYKLQDKVIFKDWMLNDELPKILNKSAIFVYPSIPKGGWEEQFGYAMGEAGASEVPVVASRTGSIDEIVKDGETGILVEPGNVDELTLALRKLLNDNELRQKMGRAGREFVVKNFGNQVMAGKISDFLDHI